MFKHILLTYKVIILIILIIVTVIVIVIIIIIIIIIKILIIAKSYIVHASIGSMRLDTGNDWVRLKVPHYTLQKARD